MSELEDGINRVLNDPNQMEKIANLAKSLMGGGEDNQSEDLRGFDTDMVQKISGLMKGEAMNGGNDRKLLEAMRPYLSEKRRSKMDRALKLAKMAKLASLASLDFGGDEDV